jgi:hypothetical protein
MALLIGSLISDAITCEIVRYVTEVHVGRTLWSSVHLAIDRDFRDLSLPGHPPQTGITASW